MIQECETLLGMEDGWISSNTTRLKTFTRLINERRKRVNSLIWQSSGIWEYDDSEQTDLPIATTTIVDDQQDYELPADIQKIIRVEIKDIDGNWSLLQQIDQSQVKEALGEFYETAGVPLYYDLIGASLFLYPKPDTAEVTAAAGLKVYFSRDVVEFNSTATTAEPGFVDNFHRMLPIGASLDYSFGYLTNDTNRINNLRAEWLGYEKEIQSFYGARNTAKKLKISPSGEGIIGRY